MSSSTLWLGLSGLLILWLIYNILFYFFHENIIFQGTRIEENHNFHFNFEYEDVWLKPNDDVLLHGILLKKESPKGIVIYFHGNRGNIERWGKIGNEIRKSYNYDVLVFDYRGYGKSRGHRSEQELYDDAEFIYDFVRTNYKYESVVIQGRSLGTAIATHLASKREADHLILETPMTLIREVIPILNWLLIDKSWLNYEFNSISRIDRISCPITIIHGTNDHVVPYALGHELYVKIGHSRKKIITIDQGKHNNLDTFEAYQQALERILE